MAALSISDYVEAALDAIGPGSLQFWSSYSPHLDNVTLAEVLIDLDFSREGLQALISRIHSMREAGDSLSKVRLHAAEEVHSWITSASIKNVSQNSVGVALLKDAGSMAFLSTGPQESTWKFLTRDSQYYPLVALTDEIRGQVRNVLETKLGGAFKGTKESYDASGRLCRNLLHVWRLMLDHWLHLKAEQDPGVAGNRRGPRIKAEANDYMDVVEDIGTSAATSSSNQFRRKRTRSPNFGQTPVAASPQKRPKRESSQTAVVEPKRESRSPDLLEKANVGEAYVIPPYPASWPQAIVQRLNQIPPLQEMPEISPADILHTFSRTSFSTTFGSNPQRMESRWRRTPKANVDMKDSGQDYIIAPTLDWNPYLPHSPCAPGLLFREPGARQDTAPEFLNGRPEYNTVFVRLGEGRWLYVGEYLVKLAAPLTEWKDLSVTVRDYWKDEFSPGKRLKLREGVDAQQMRKALDEGSDHLEVYTMECVAYHEPIQRAIMQL